MESANIRFYFIPEAVQRSVHFFSQIIQTLCCSGFSVLQRATERPALCWLVFQDHSINAPAHLFVCSRLLSESARGVSSSRQEGGEDRPPSTQLYTCYDLDDLDVAWLELANQEFRQMGECWMIMDNYDDYNKQTIMIMII